jgi:hypothetical protein
MYEFVLFVAGTVIGGLITRHYSVKFYLRASEDLHNEAKQIQIHSAALQRLTNLILAGLENGQLIEVKRDETTGKAVGIIASRAVTFGGRGSAHGVSG